ncbi:MAG: peptidoglycan recognition family protein [Candidatus Thiodiazotropha sp.]
MDRRKFLIYGSSFLGLLGLSAYYWPNRWKYIVVHHSAGNYGNIEFLQKVHRERQPIDPVDAIPYHYIIGNGNGLADGEISSDSRKKYHIWGAHVSANNIDRNLRGIGICVIGNLEVNQITNKQYQSLVKLTIKLMDMYGIPVRNVTGHGSTEGESTKCPGKNFPMQQYLNDIAKNN